MMRRDIAEALIECAGRLARDECRTDGAIHIITSDGGLVVVAPFGDPPYVWISNERTPDRDEVRGVVSSCWSTLPAAEPDAPGAEAG